MNRKALFFLLLSRTASGEAGTSGARNAAAGTGTVPAVSPQTASETESAVARKGGDDRD